MSTIIPFFLKKLFLPPETKLVLSAFSDEMRRIDESSDQRDFAKSIGAKLITPAVINLIFTWAKHIKTDIQNGKPPRAIALWLMTRVARDYVASGRFHIYRGALSMQGIGLKAMCMYCYDELTKMGEMSNDERIQALEATNEEIREVG